MNYAGAFGCDIDSKILQGIASACELYRAGKLHGPEEAAFIENYIALAKATSPVTVRSLKSCIIERPVRNFLFQTVSQTPADRILRTYRFYGFLALIVLVILQSYWVIGSFLVANIPLLSEDPNRLPAAVRQRAIWMQMTFDIPPPTETNLDVLQQLDNEHEIRDDDQNSEKKPDDNGAHSTVVKISRETFIREQAILKAREDTYTRFMDIWASPAATVTIELESLFQVRHGSDQSKSPAWLSSVIAKQVLSLLQTYVLPPLYGWLGAIAYVLRRLIAEIRSRTYQEDSDTSYNLRIYLGILAGLAIGWGFTSSSLPTGDVVRALSPLALAFLAGYSVELLFSAMDRILEAFSTSSATSKPFKA